LKLTETSVSRSSPSRESLSRLRSSRLESLLDKPRNLSMMKTSPRWRMSPRLIGMMRISQGLHRPQSSCRSMVTQMMNLKPLTSRKR
jgi:hypothetical protein